MGRVASFMLYGLPKERGKFGFLDALTASAPAAVAAPQAAKSAAQRSHKRNSKAKPKPKATASAK